MPVFYYCNILLLDAQLAAPTKYPCCMVFYLFTSEVERGRRVERSVGVGLLRLEGLVEG